MLKRWEKSNSSEVFFLKKRSCFRLAFSIFRKGWLQTSNRNALFSKESYELTPKCLRPVASFPSLPLSFFLILILLLLPRRQEYVPSANLAGLALETCWFHMPGPLEQ